MTTILSYESEALLFEGNTKIEPKAPKYGYGFKNYLQ